MKQRIATKFVLACLLVSMMFPILSYSASAASPDRYDPGCGCGGGRAPSDPPGMGENAGG